MKKILAVATALVLAISSLCVFVVADETYTISNASGWTTISSVNSDLYTALTTSGATVTVSFTVVSATNNDVKGDYWFALSLQDTTTWANETTLSSSGSGAVAGDTVSVTFTDLSGLTGSSYFIENGSNLVFNPSGLSATDITVIVTVPGTTSDGNTGGGGSTVSGTRFIYVDETYHALIVNGHFICSEHDVDSNGYCTVCKEYIGLDGEEVTVTIDGGEYVAAFSNDLNAVSGNWNKVSLGDSSLISALSTEGAILVVTRVTETILCYAAGDYD